jgi:type III pantothenate kinase
MILACDIGNSSSSFGIFEDAKYNPVETFRIDTKKISTEQDLKKFLSKNTVLKKLSGVCVSSVVPSANPIYDIFFNKIKLRPFFILPKIKLNITLCIENSAKLGSDRIANACWSHFYNQNSPDKKFQIIIDIGTAVTIDSVNKNGDFLGGIIYPGINSLAKCLYESTEKLPLIKINKPKNLIGTNTESAIQSGIYNGILYLIKGFVSDICDFYGICGDKNIRLIYTGGQSALIFNDININAENIIDEFCTLKGIKYLYDINK